MMYYEEFLDKFGFNDGEAVPPDARESREVYVRTLNKLLAELGSKNRAFAFDNGCHNPFMIFYTTLEDMEAYGVTEDELHDADEVYGKTGDGFGEFDPELDDACKKAIAIAHVMNLDEYIHFDIAIHPSFEERIGGGISKRWLKQLQKEAVE
jgi:hypothetical protein